jgi:hypothetical protein
MSRSTPAAKKQDAHDEQDGEELESDAPAHELLRKIGTAAAQHIRETHEQDKCHRDKRGADGRIRKRVHELSALDAYVARGEKKICGAQAVA